MYVKTSKCWIYMNFVFVVYLSEKMNMLSALIAPFKYVSPAANGTEDEDTLSQYGLSHLF